MSDKLKAVKYMLKESISLSKICMFILCIAMACSNLSFSSVSAQSITSVLPDKYNVMPSKEWTINFNKPYNYDTVNYNNIKIYDKSTGKEISIIITKDYSDKKYIKIKPSVNYIKGKAYTLEIKNIYTENNKTLINNYKMDFYIKNIYAGLPAQNGLIIMEDKAYDVGYLKKNSKVVNDIILSKNFDIYYNYDISYQSILSLLNFGFITQENTARKYDEITYVDASGNKLLYKWNTSKEEYELIPASIDVSIIVRSDIKLVSIKPSNIVAVPEAKYFKIKNSNLIKNIGDTIAYTSTDTMEELYVLSQDKVVIAKANLYIANNNNNKYYLKVNDNYGAGNTAGNINNNGLVAEDDEGYLYYVNAGDKEKLYKMGLNNISNIKIGEDKIQYVNIVSDWVYYSNYSDGGKLYKSKKDASLRQKISDDRAAYVTLSGEYIYYSNHSDGGKLYRIKKDGSDVKIDSSGLKHGSPVIMDNGNYDKSTDEVAYINIDGDWIYYSNFSDGHKPYVINKEGTYRAKLGNEWANSVQVYGDWVYYCSGTGVISKVRKDGSGVVVPVKAQAASYNKSFYINVFEDWLYYSNAADGDKLYKINTSGSGEKVKLSDDAATYINIAARTIYYNTKAGKLMKLPIDNKNVKPEEVGKNIVVESVTQLDNLAVTVSYKDVNLPIGEIEKKYLPNKVSAFLANNTIQQLVVIWDTNFKNVTIKNGVHTYKGNVIGYNKTVTIAVSMPSEMLNDTNDIYVYNNNEKNDNIEIMGTKDGKGVKIQEGDIIKVYDSNEETRNLLGQANVLKNRTANIQKLDLNGYGKSIWLTITRKGKAESAPTEIVQTEAGIINISAAKDLDDVFIGADGRDISISSWIPSKINNPIKQHIYLVPNKTILDMKNQVAVDKDLAITANTWSGSKYNKDNVFKKDSKGTVIKSGIYDIYIAAEYIAKATPDVDGNIPYVYGKVSCDTPSTFTILDESLPQKPTIKKQNVTGEGEILLDKAPLEGEVAWLVSDSWLTNVRNWKSEIGIANNPFDALASSNPLEISKLVGDGVTKVMSPPKGFSDKNIDCKLFITNKVGASLESDAKITVDNMEPALTMISGSNILLGDKISVKSNENGKIYLVSAYNTINNLEQLQSYEKMVVTKSGAVIKVDTTGLEALVDNPYETNYKLVGVDEAGNISDVQYINVWLNTSDLRDLIEFADSEGISLVEDDPVKLSKLNSAIVSAQEVLEKAEKLGSILQSEIVKTFNSLKSVIIQVGVPVTANIDTTAPKLVTGYTKAANITNSSVDVFAKVNEASEVYILILPKTSLMPTITQLVNSQDSNGNAVLTSGTIVVNSNEEKSLKISNLQAKTQYAIYTVAKDSKNNLSAIQITNFTTAE